jgi:hypothetical protein
MFLFVHKINLLCLVSLIVDWIINIIIVRYSICLKGLNPFITECTDHTENDTDKQNFDGVLVIYFVFCL